MRDANMNTDGIKGPVAHRLTWHAQAVFGDVPDHFQSTSKRESGILMAVHPAGFLEGQVFGDFQFSTLSSDAPRITRIES